MSSGSTSKKKKPKEFEYKAIKLKSSIGPEVAVETVKKIMKHVGFSDLGSRQVEELCHYIESEFLCFKDNSLWIKLNHSVPDADGKPVFDFKFSECNDAKLLKHDVDIVGLVQGVGRGDGIDSDDVRTIVALSLGIQKDLAGSLTTKDILEIYALYSLFFIGL